MTTRKNKALAPEQPKLLTEKEAAQYLGVSLSYLRKGRCDGVLRNGTPTPKFVKLGDRVLYPTSECDAWEANLVRMQVIR